MKKMITIFISGIIIGGISAWIFTNKTAEKKYKKIADEEIKSVKETFSYKADAEPDKLNYEDVINKEYAQYAETIDEEPKDKDMEPYVIHPEKFGERSDYDQISFMYYSDNVLVDENDEVVHDIDGSVGLDSLNHFGEYEDDSVYVQNDRLHTYYEILLSDRKYSDVLIEKPYLGGV